MGTARADDADGDLATVRNEQAPNAHDGSGSTRISRAWWCANSPSPRKISVTVPSHARSDGVEQLHRLDEPDDAVRLDAGADLREGRVARLGRPVERSRKRCPHVVLALAAGRFRGGRRTGHSRPGGYLRHQCRPARHRRLLGPAAAGHAAEREREAVGAQVQLVEPRLIEQAEDLEHVCVAERHVPREGGGSPLSDAEEPHHERERRLAATVGDRLRPCEPGRGDGARLHDEEAVREAAVPGNRPLDVLPGAKVPLDAAAQLDERDELLLAEARLTAPLLGHVRACRPAPAGIGEVLDVLARDRAAEQLARDLRDDVLVRRHVAADDTEPEPQAALIATTLGSPVTGLHVNITPDTSASTISCTTTPIAGALSRSRAGPGR